MSRNDQRSAMDAIVANYPQIGIPTDQLPYTPEFEVLRGRVAEQTRLSFSDHEFWILLTRARKRGLLPRLR